MWSINQVGEEWELLGADGNRVGELHATYDLALGELATRLQAQLATATGDLGDDGLLPDVWRSDMVFQEETGDGRDFTDCTFSWRDPNVSLLPLMLQTATDFGHFGAQLAGFILSIEGTSLVGGTGRFYDSETGRQFRNMLKGGRRFGVSVDPGPNTEAEFTCTEEDDDGWCIDGRMTFSRYEIIGLTGTPFPAFARAFIELQGEATEATDEDDEAAEGETAVQAVAAAASIPTAPPSAWFDEPDFGELTPLTITDDGRVMGHVAGWGQCHVGYPGTCMTAPSSPTSYAHFHVGVVRTAEGADLPTGTLTMGADHAPLRGMNPQQARDHYSNTALAWADVRAGEDAHGVWVAGALRPTLDDITLRVLRGSALSGDWRRIGGQMEMIAVLAVNSPGFPIERALVASGSPMPVQLPRLRAHMVGHQVDALVAAGVVVPCQDCRQHAEAAVEQGQVLQVLTEVRQELGRLERRTRHLLPAAASAAAASLRR